MEAMKQGSLSVAVKSQNCSVLLALKKNPSKLACYQEKIFQINQHNAVVVSGITADARVLIKYIRVKNAKHRLKYGVEMNVNQIAGKFAKIFRSKTYLSGKRPFGCGLLLTGKD
jgi:20S proteasome subunit alpha 6